MIDDRMTVEERAARKSEIRARLDEINDEYSGAALPEEFRSEWDDLMVELGDHERAIEETTERAEQLRTLAARNEGTNGVERRGSRDVMVAPKKPDNIYDLTELRQRARTVDEIPALMRDNAMRAIETARYPGTVRKADAQAQAEQLLTTVDDDQGTLARRILTTGSPVYDRAFGKAVLARGVHGLSAEEQRAMSLGTDSEGGFAVPFQLDPTVILTSDGSINPLRQIARTEQIVGKEWQGITSAGITVSRKAEAAEATDDSPTFAQPTVKAERVDGFVPFSMELDQDWARLRSEITRLLAEAKDDEEADSFVTGDGTGVNAGGVVATLDASSEVAEGTGGTFAVDDLFTLEEELPPRFRARARWLANKTVYNRIRTGAFGSDGADLWVRLASGQPSELIGYPAHEASAMDSPGTADNRYLLFGDFSQFLIVDRIGMSVELVPHVFHTGNNRPSGQRGIFAFWRNNSVVLVDNAFRVLVDGTV
jgi:HK97 family phage major capsid protein